MVGDYDDSKVSKIIGELYDIEIYGDCAKATLKVTTLYYLGLKWWMQNFHTCRYILGRWIQIKK